MVEPLQPQIHAPNLNGELKTNFKHRKKNIYVFSFQNDCPGIAKGLDKQK